MNASIHSGSSDRGFTLTDLLVLIATFGLLAILVFPALAGVQNKGGRVECANNLRQIGMESMVFAGENNGWFPVCTLGAANGEGAKSNFLGGIHYTRYVYYEGAPNTQITTNEPPIPNGGGYQNLGYLYQAGLAGNGNIFYCPAVWGDGVMGANAYSPLLTADSTGTIRSSYFYNPRMLNPNINTGWPIRRYQTVSQLEPHRLFAVDAIIAGESSGPIDGGEGTRVNQATIAHIRDRGWNVLFTDGSVQFSRLTQNNNYLFNLITVNLSGSESEASYEGYDQTFTFLEQDH
jgi:type II secretory pathway pseudopilin PulG